MTPADPLVGLVGVERTAVTMVYFEGRTIAHAARNLGLEPHDVGALLAAAFRRVATTVGRS